MSQNSFTSNSSYKLYLLVLLVCSALLCAFVLLIGHINHLRHVHMPYEDIYQYQMEKIKNAGPTDTIFLGDSSLGNAINAALWSKLTKDNTMNLALTAGYGYEGAYVMLINALASNMHPKNVVIFFYPRQIMEGTSDLIFLESPALFGNPDVPLQRRLMLSWKMNMNIDSLVSNLRNLFKKKVVVKQNPEFTNDYMAQLPVERKDSKLAVTLREIEPKPVSPETILYLKKIYETCENNNLRCIYVHGPIIGSDCHAMDKVIETADMHMKQIGFEIVKGTPVCAPYSHMGDVPFHLRPEVKDLYTRKYYELIKPYWH